MLSAGSTIGRKQTFVKWGNTKSTSHNVTSKVIEEDCVSSLEQNYGNTLLSLRAALNEKELQLVELREQHLSVVNRAAIARKNWEDAITCKEQLIVQLQKALHFKKCELDRQERVNEENVRRLLHKQHEEENAELVQKQRTISLLEHKSAQFVEELVEQQKTITQLKRQVEEKERQRASCLHKGLSGGLSRKGSSSSDGVLNLSKMALQMEVLQVRVQDLKAALQQKEEAVATQKNYCQDLKGMVWKRDAMIGQLQLAEQQLQSSLARQEAEHEALQCLKEKLQEEKVLVEKSLAQFKENQGRSHSNALHKVERALQERDVFLRNQRRQILDLQKSLQSKEIALIRKHEDQQHLLEENKRLVNGYESLRHNFKHAQRKQQLLELDLEAVQERLSKAGRRASLVTPGRLQLLLKKIMVHRWVIAEAEQSTAVASTQHTIDSEGSITEDQAPDTGVDDVDAERQSMASIGSTAMNMVSRAKNISNKSKSHSHQKGVLLKGFCPTFPTGRDRISLKSREGISGTFEALRSLPSDGNDHVSTSEYTNVDRNLYSSSPKTANKLEGNAQTAASSVNARPRTNVHFDGSGEAGTCIVSGSSERSSPLAKVALRSSSEIDGMTGGERSSTSPETSQTQCLAKKNKKSLTSMSNCRERLNSYSRRNLCTEDSPSQLFPSTNSYSSIVADPHTKWTCQTLETVQSLGAPKPLSSEQEIERVPNLKIPGSPGQSEGSSFLEFQNCSNPLPRREPKPGTNLNHERGYSSRKLSRPLSAVPGKTVEMVVRLPALGPQYRQGSSSKVGESLKPPTPAYINIRDSCDTALKSLQEEVMKRERGWRRTEASMRAALCQRLKDLKDAEKLNVESFAKDAPDAEVQANDLSAGGGAA